MDASTKLASPRFKKATVFCRKSSLIALLSRGGH
jgi:hypothetical protein